MRFRLQFLEEAIEDYSRELKWSQHNWGHVHAQEYFEKIDILLSNLCANPFLYPERPGLKESYRVAKIPGMTIAYRANPQAQIIVVLAFIGRNRFYELEQLVKTRQ
jgi:plasmid stabilization system protein ParE